MTEVGIELRSTDEFAPVPPGTKRRPLTNIRVRLEPSPRRLIRVEPSPPLLDWVLVALDCTVSVCSTSPMEVNPRALISSLDRTTTGAGERLSALLMREPVTTISSNS